MGLKVEISLECGRLSNKIKKRKRNNIYVLKFRCGNGSFFLFASLSLPLLWLINISISAEKVTLSCPRAGREPNEMEYHNRIINIKHTYSRAERAATMTTRKPSVAMHEWGKLWAPLKCASFKWSERIIKKSIKVAGTKKRPILFTWMIFLCVATIVFITWGCRVADKIVSSWRSRPQLANPLIKCHKALDRRIDSSKFISLPNWSFWEGWWKFPLNRNVAVSLPE